MGLKMPKKCWNRYFVLKNGFPDPNYVEKDTPHAYTVKRYKKDGIYRVFKNVTFHVIIFPPFDTLTVPSPLSNFFW